MTPAPVEFTVKGEPVAWMRAAPGKPDVGLIASILSRGRAAGRSIGQVAGDLVKALTGPKMHNPKRMVYYESRVAWSGRIAMRGKAPFEGPLQATVLFYYEAQARRPKRDAALTIFKDTKPDSDNLIANVFDALNGIAYRDDGQIAVTLIGKAWAPVGEEPRVEVRIEPVNIDWPPRFAPKETQCPK